VLNGVSVTYTQAFFTLEWKCRKLLSTGRSWMKLTLLCWNIYIITSDKVGHNIFVYFRKYFALPREILTFMDSQV